MSSRTISTNPRARALLAGLAVTLIAAGCGSSSSGDEPAATTAAAAAPAQPATTVADEAAAPRSVETEAPADTTAPKTDPPTTETTTVPAATVPATTVPATTVPAMKALTIEPVAELAGRFIRSAFTDGTAIMGVSQSDDADSFGNEVLVKLDLAGNIVQEVPLENSNVFDLVDINGTRWVYGSYREDGSYKYQCGFRPLDLASLAMGPALVVSTDGSCGGGVGLDDSSPTVAWTLDPSDKLVNKVDTASGSVTPMSLDAVVPLGYEPGNLILLGGNAYVTLYPGWDDVTEKQLTAPDGSELPPFLARIDGATGAAIAQQVPGSVGSADGKLLIYAKGKATHEIDSTTLAATAVDANEFADRPRGEVVTGDGVAWSLGGFGGSALTVAQRDPATLRVVAQGSVDTAAADGAWVDYSSIPIGTDLYVVASQQTSDPSTNSNTSITKLFHTVAQ